MKELCHVTTDSYTYIYWEVGFYLTGANVFYYYDSWEGKPKVRTDMWWWGNTNPYQSVGLYNEVYIANECFPTWD
jgi:hypothetical protein